MSLIKLPKQKTVSYLDQEIQIPENHDWVALSFRETATGRKLYLVSFKDEPELRNGSYFTHTTGEDYKLLTLVENSTVEPKDSLVYVGEPTRDTLYDAFEVLVGDLVKIMNTDKHQDEKLHEVFCMKHGALSQFLQKNARELSDRFDAPSLDGEVFAEQLQASIGKSAVIKQITEALGIPLDNIRVIGGDELEEILSGVPKPRYS